MSRLPFLCLPVIATLIGPGAGWAPGQPAYRDMFEGALPSWRLVAADGPYQVLEHARVQRPVHSGSWSEHVAIAGRSGSYVYAAHDVGRAQIIDELTLRVWIRADQPGLQFAARLVLPRTIDPATGRPITTLLYGDIYRTAGRWQPLVIDRLPQRVARQVRVVRSGSSTPIDEREAYIDQVLLNVYGGPGTTQVWIDDLEITGFVGRLPDDKAAAARPFEQAGSLEQEDDSEQTGYGDAPPGDGRAPSGDARGTGATRPPVRVVGSVLLIDGRPAFVQAIDWRGEPFEYLKSLGFNTVKLSAAATEAQRQTAWRLGLWLICPPPTLAEGATIDGSWDAVLSWNIGEGLTDNHLESTVRDIRQLRGADHRVGRPVIARPQTELRTYSRHLDLLLAHREPLGTSLELTDYTAWLRELPLLARPGTPLWTVIQTEPAATWTSQVAALSSGAAAADVDVSQIRHLAYSAVAAGGRGLCFASRSRLDAENATNRRRAAALELINLELQLIAPWIASGRFVTPARSSDPRVHAAVLQTEQARLLLPIRSSGGAQHVATEPSDKPVTFVVPGIPASNHAYELTPAGIRPLAQQRVTGGMLVTLNEPTTVGMVVLTQDPAVMSSFARQIEQIRERAARLQRDLAVDQFALAEQLDVRIADSSGTPRDTPQQLTQARQRLSDCERSLAAGDAQQAWHHASGAMLDVTRLQRQRFSAAVRQLGPPGRLPLLGCYATLPTAYLWVQQTGNQPLGENRVPAGEMEDLEKMLAAGWRHVQLTQAEILSDVELSTQLPQSGLRSLHLRVVRGGDSAPQRLEASPVWVQSAPLPVAAGEVIQIKGWARIPEPITGGVDGLLVFDSLGGPPLAQRLAHTSGWQEFTMYRAATETGQVTLTFALAGFGDAWIDNVTVRPVAQGGHDITADRLRGTSDSLPPRRATR